MRLVLNDPMVLRAVFEALNSLYDTIRLKFDRDGVSIDALDNSHIVYAHMTLSSSIFDEYKCNKPTKAIVDPQEITKVLRRAKPSDTLTISKDSENLVLTFEGEATRQFKIKLMDIEYEPPQPPKIEYNNEVKIPTSLLKDAVTDTGLLSDKIMIETDRRKIIISSKDGWFGDARVEYEHSGRVTEPAKSFYSTEKVREMMRADKFSETATINLGNDMPLKLTFRMPEGGGELSFLLAPRLEVE